MLWLLLVRKAYIWGSYDEYPQSMIWKEIRKSRNTKNAPSHPLMYTFPLAMTHLFCSTENALFKWGMGNILVTSTVTIQESFLKTLHLNRFRYNSGVMQCSPVFLVTLIDRTKAYKPHPTTLWFVKLLKKAFKFQFIYTAYTLH